MKSKTVVLREEHSGEDSRYLRAHIAENGDLQIEGHDLGPTVGKFFGPGNDEYEWDITVAAGYLPRLISALGGNEGDDLLSLLNEQNASREFLEQHGIPILFWNRIGD